MRPWGCRTCTRTGRWDELPEPGPELETEPPGVEGSRGKGRSWSDSWNNTLQHSLLYILGHIRHHHSSLLLLLPVVVVEGRAWWG